MTSRVLAVLALLAVVVLAPPASHAQRGPSALETVARAMGEPGLKSIQFTGGGVNFAAGQNASPSLPWPRFNVRSFTRSVNYETASLQDEIVRAQGEDPPRGGGQQPVRGEQRQVFVVSGDHAWNVQMGVAVPAPIALIDRQVQLWATPHGVVKAALAHRAHFEGRTIAFSVPGRFRVRARVDDRNLIERVEATLTNAVLGDTTVEVSYTDYRDVGGVKFPTRIRQTMGAFPTLDLTVTDVKPNAPVDIPVPDTVSQSASPYARVTTQMVADGVWYITGGTHHSVAIEMGDHVIVVEAPLNDERALAVIAEVRGLVPDKPIRSVINSHHHFDHAGGLRAFAGEGVTVITHEVNRAFLERALAAPATVVPDHLAKSGRRGRVEGVRDRRVLTGGTRTVEIHHVPGNLHHDGLLMVYLPKERLLIEADAFTPLPPNTPYPAPPNPFSVNLADAVARLGIGVDQLLPLHGRIVPLSELHRAIGRSN
jgi:glyoxylase-like metal-dependent hydrolase (beta-lactamase superfamily II)